MDENFIGKKQEIKLLQAIKEGLFHNEYSVSVQYQVTLDDLFVDWVGYKSITTRADHL